MQPVLTCKAGSDELIQSDVLKFKTWRTKVKPGGTSYFTVTIENPDGFVMFCSWPAAVGSASVWHFVVCKRIPADCSCVPDLQLALKLPTTVAGAFS